MLPVVILAGGLATRLYPLTRTIPKSLIPIAGLPFIDHQLALLSEKGVTQVVLCIGNFGTMIEAHVGDGSRYGLEVRYSCDGDVLLGTGGAIKKAAGILPGSFFILYGDSYLDIEFGPVVEQFNRGKNPVLMTVYRNRDAHGTSNIIMKDGRVLKYDKKEHDPAMDHIDYGLIAIRKNIFDPCPADTSFDLATVLSRLADAGQVMGYEVTKRFYEIGSPSGIRETEEYIMTRRPDSYQG